ncbi:MAG: hypothetical protein N2513_08450 [Deltaproteobacteria bacterium]|nr:hypothetical protein [Deltaproteobacteria bacterium]
MNGKIILKEGIIKGEDTYGAEDEIRTAKKTLCNFTGHREETL